MALREPKYCARKRSRTRPVDALDLPFARSATIGAGRPAEPTTDLLAARCGAFGGGPQNACAVRKDVISGLRSGWHVWPPHEW